MRSKRPRTEEQPAAPATPSIGSASDREKGVVVERSGTADRQHLLALHKARFVEWTPTAAVASAASDDGSVLAVARESGDIELWQTDYWHCLAVGNCLVVLCLRIVLVHIAIPEQDCLFVAHEDSATGYGRVTQEVECLKGSKFTCSRTQRFTERK